MNRLIILSVFFSLLSCGSQRNSSYLKRSGSEFTLEVETTPCFGKCSVYNLTIKESGLAVYDGKNFPDTGGEVFKPLPSFEIDSLRYILSQNNFFELDSVYDNPSVTDLPSMSLQLDLGNGASHKVKGRYNTPVEWDNIAAFIERLRKRNFD